MASYDDDFSEKFKYVHRIPSDDSPVDIDSILAFFNNIKNDDYVNTMRQHAERTLTWDNKMIPVIDRIFPRHLPKTVSNK